MIVYFTDLGTCLVGLRKIKKVTRKLAFRSLTYEMSVTEIIQRLYK
jgi:hypothetical protein